MTSRPRCERTPPRRRPVAQRGLTFVELMLAMSIMALIGLAASSLFVAIASGTTDEHDVRGLTVRQQVLTARLSAALRSARQVLAVGDDHLVLWIADSREDDQPNLSELRRIEYDAAAGQVISYTASFDSQMTEPEIEAADTSYDIASDFAQVTTDLVGTDHWVGEVWSNEVRQFSLDPDHEQPSLARLIRYEMTVSNGTSAELAAVGCVAMRN